MEFTDERSALRTGALLVVTSAETAYRLDALDTVLKPWIRSHLNVLADLMYGSDTLREVAEDTRRVAQAAADYSHLRQRLLVDLREAAPEPPWRVAETGVMAIRAQSQARLPQPTFVLRSLTPKSAAGNGSTWEFTVIPARADSTRSHGTFTLRIPGGGPHGALTPVHITPDLAAQGAWCQQADYGFRALGVCPFLTVPEDSPPAETPTLRR